MKKYIKFFIIFLIFIIILVFILIKTKNKKSVDNKQEEQITLIQDVEIKEEENKPLIINTETKQKEQIIEEEVKDPATLTNEIYSINGPIGHLYIPKTGVDTDIYSNQTVSKMEEMPCFLYTTGGLNQAGITLFTGHNRVNGTLFSDNGKLEINDEFYFKDLSGKELKYKIISKEVLPDTDTSFLQKDVDKPNIVLSCCTDNNDNYRIIIIGQAE